MKATTVSLKDRSYRIAMGSLKGVTPTMRSLGFKNCPVFIVTTAAVKRAGYSSTMIKTLKFAGFHPTLAVIPNGERQKTLETLQSLYRKALAAKLDRRSLVIALGGGVVTDLAGFLAATYMRGVSLISVPTTLLAMVDAAIGGKTGVDLPEGKNLIGAFWQPRLVWIDPAVLKTLPEREWKTGFAEIIKYGVIGNKTFFQWLAMKMKRNAQIRRWSSHDIEHAIFESISAKARVVSADERETPLKGGREILNFGHTFGHALEAATGYRRFTHGEAISIGMLCAGRLALELGTWSEDAQLQLTLAFEAAGLPIRFPKLSKKEMAEFWKALRNDKKNIGGKLRFVVPLKIGQVRVQSGISEALVKRAVSGPLFKTKRI